MATTADLRDTTAASIVPEEFYGLMEQGVYIFLVHTDANKTQIKIMVQEIFGAKVASVNTLNREGKRKRSCTSYGKHKNTKRTYVTLAVGSDPIDIFGGSVAQSLADEEIKEEQKYGYS